MNTANSNNFCTLPEKSKRRALFELVKKALANYDINIVNLRFYVEHSNYLFKADCSDNKSYVMKVMSSNDHNISHLESHLEWLHFAHEKAGISVNKVCKTTAGNFVVTESIPSIKEQWYCALFEWAPGKILKHALSAPNAFRWGKLMASLHNFSIAHPIKPHSGIEIFDKVFYWDKEVIFDPEFCCLMPKKRVEIFKQVYSCVKGTIKDLYRTEAVPILIHGDLHPYNIKVHKKELTALDFDECLLGHPIQDISNALLYVRHNPKFPKLEQAFIEGYSSLRKWPENSSGVIKTFFMGRLLLIANEIVNSEDDQEETMQTLKRYEDEFSDFLKNQCKQL